MQIEELVANGLEGNEFVSMLSWIMKTYPGVELMSHPDLQIDLSTLGPLMKPELLKAMENEYLKTIDRNFDVWMKNTLDGEIQDWLKPLSDQDDQYYHTNAPVIIFQMIGQHLDVAKTIHSELTFSMLVLSIKQVIKYGFNYRTGIIDFKVRHFKDRNQAPYFTQHFITIVNNCQQILELAQHMKQLYWPKGRTEHYEEFEKLLKTYNVS